MRVGTDAQGRRREGKSSGVSVRHVVVRGQDAVDADDAVPLRAHGGRARLGEHLRHVEAAQDLVLVDALQRRPPEHPAVLGTLRCATAVGAVGAGRPELQHDAAARCLGGDGAQGIDVAVARALGLGALAVARRALAAADQRHLLDEGLEQGVEEA